MPFKDPERNRKYQRQRAARLKAEWIEKSGSCVLCGSKDSLEVDHRDPKTKVDHAIWSWSTKRREQELVKCQVLCHKCHKDKTIAELSIPTPHGTHSGYSYHGCRCESCTSAHREYMADYYRKKFLR